MDSRHFIGFHVSRGRSGGSGWTRGPSPDQPSCLWEATPEAFFHFAHSWTQLSPLSLPWLSPSSLSSGIIFPKNLSLSFLVYLSIQTLFSAHMFLSRQKSQFGAYSRSLTPSAAVLTPAFHQHPIPTVSPAFSSTIIIPPSCIYPIPTHNVYAPLSILSLTYALQFNFSPAALLIRPLPCTSVTTSFSWIPCLTFKNYFHSFSKGLLSPFHVPGPDRGPKPPPHGPNSSLTPTRLPN